MMSPFHQRIVVDKFDIAVSKWGMYLYSLIDEQS